MNQHLTDYAPWKPRKGDALTYRGKPHGTVKRVEGGLCIYTRDDDGAVEPFIWCFQDGLNTLFRWPGKDESKIAVEFISKRSSSFMEMEK